MESRILKALQKIRRETQRKHKVLREACDSFIEQLQSKDLHEDESEDGGQDVDADKYFEPFKLACESKSPKVMELALDAIQKLVEHGNLRGTSTVAVQGQGGLDGSRPNQEVEGGEEDGPSTAVLLMDVIIKTICACNEVQDDNVQLQAVRACYNIHLVSRNQVNKTTAKATLTQMLNIVFHRMEAFDLRAREEATAALHAMEVEARSRQNSVTFSNRVSSARAIATPPPIKTEAIPEEKEAGNGELDDTSGSNPLPCGSYMYPAVYIHLAYVPRGNRPISLIAKPDAVGSYGTPEFPSVLHKDAYLLFRALCKLSMKAITDDPSIPSDPVALQSKILSLELLLSILDHAGPTFRSSEKFVYLVRSYLCVSLLKNATSSNTQVVGLSLRIFIAMTSHFKDHLKSEIEVFISNIFLRLLESENSSFDHKILVLEVFYNLCQDPQTLIEIFLNYDCDLGATSMFKRIVNALAKVAKGRPGVEPGGSSKRGQEENALRTLGLEGLVAITHSLVRSGGLEDASTVAGKGQEGKMVGTPGGNANDMELSNSESPVVAASEDANPAMSVVESFDRKQKIQEELAMGVLKFNLKPSTGLAYLESHGHLSKTPTAVAKFLHDYCEKLDKTVIGDYLGKEKEYDSGFCVKVLHEYVDMMDFTNLRFDDAIRHFLSGFRLPGEAQKIDRIMEKFAERYCLQNNAIFPSADTAFILSFSVIMLNTDLHNPSIKEERKMTKEDFIRNNRGISAGADLPEEFLSEIYDNIKRNPISLKEDDEMRAKMSQAGGVTENPFLSTLSLDKRRKEAYQKEREAMLRSSEAIFRQRKRRPDANTPSYVSRSELTDTYVRPMFEVAWGPMLSVFSQMIENSDDPKLVGLSLKGFKHAVRIAAHYNIPTARDMLINTIYKFTTLDVVKEMKPKNIECIRALIAIAISDGNHLQECWLYVLQCISHLARLQLFASGLQSDDVYFPSDAEAERTARAGSTAGPNGFSSIAGLGMPSGAGGMSGGSTMHKKKSTGLTAMADPFKIFTGPSKAEAVRQVEEQNAEQIMGQIDSSMIERVFATSVNLTSEAIQHFVIKLCEVSKMEVSPNNGASMSAGGVYRREAGVESQQPRVFSLQKLVEVADFNMTSRSRLVWANVWEVLSKHFAAVGLHENISVAMYAIDSLRQLSMKFLYKEELRDFNFQRLFLKPFEMIMASSKSTEIRELILRCIDNLILARAHNIRSGWKSIFSVFSIGSASTDEGIAQFAFDMTDHIFRDHFDLLVFDFVDLVNCLLSFAEGQHLHISLAAITHLQKAASLLAEGHVTHKMAIQRQNSFMPDVVNTPPTMPAVMNFSPDGSNGDLVSPAGGGVFMLGGSTNGGESQLQLWWPLLVGLSARVADPRLPARTSALEALMNTLRQHGDLFSFQTWKLIFRGVLFPMLESARTDCTPQVISEYPSQDPPMEVRDDSWILTTTETVLRSYLELLRQFWSVTRMLVPEVLSVFADCICQHERETLARIGVRVLRQHLLPFLGDKREPDVWDAVCQCFLGIVRKNLPDWGSLDMMVKEQAAMGLGGQQRSKRVLSTVEEAEKLEIGQQVNTMYGPGVVSKIRADGRAEVDLVNATGATSDAKGEDEVVAVAGAADGEEASFEEGRESRGTEEEEEDDEDEEDMEDALAFSQAGEDPRSSSFSFAMVNNGTIMTQMVVVLQVQQLLREFLQTKWVYLTEENLLRVVNALTESAEYAAEFNANIPLRERLRVCGLMQSALAHSTLSKTLHFLAAHHPGVTLPTPGSARLPHLLDQAINGYTFLYRFLFSLYTTNGGMTTPTSTSNILTSSSNPSNLDSGSDSPVGAVSFAKQGAGLTWDRIPLVERLLVRYCTIVLKHYSGLEDEISRRSVHPANNMGPSSSSAATMRANQASTAALNAELSAYTPLILLVLQGFRSLTLEQVSYHLDWMYPALADLIPSRSLEVRSEVRDLFLTKLGPFVTSGASTPAQPPSKGIKL